LILVKQRNIKDKLLNLLSNKFIGGNIYVLTGASVSLKIVNSLFEGLPRVTVLQATDTQDFINVTINKIAEKDVVIGVGGGVIVDIAKEVSFQTNSNLIIVPTVLTNDGLASGLVVLESVNNGKSIYRKPADYIFADFSILENSPTDFMKSAVGELFSKFSSHHDWLLEQNSPHTITNALITQGLELFNKNNYKDVASILDALILLGKAINLQGDSRPASGSEHLIYHAMSNNGLLNNTRHGIAVASISLFTLFLQDKFTYKHVEILQSLEVRIDFTQLENKPLIDLYSIFEYAKNYKEDRVTILNSFSSSELVDKYFEFKKELEKYSIVWE
jgi:glycerol-1-phosphate dehydrogenase [NAD(P)+]